MSEEKDFKKAMALFSTGRREEAAVQLLGIYQRAGNVNFKLRVLDVLLSSLHPINDNQRLIELSEEGVALAEKLELTGPRSCFKAKKAEFLMQKVYFLQYEAKNLKLSPEWIGFSTEAEKDRHEMLSREKEALEQEVDVLLSQATQLAEKNPSKRELGFVLMSKGQVESSRYSQHKMEGFRSNLKAMWWLKLEFLRGGWIENFLFFDRNQRRKLKKSLDSFYTCFLRAAEIFENIDDPTAGYAYHNLANHLRIIYRFREVKKFLTKAKEIALKYKDESLARAAEKLEARIATKNKNIPDYLGLWSE